MKRRCICLGVIVLLLLTVLPVSALAGEDSAGQVCTGHVDADHNGLCDRCTDAMEFELSIEIVLDGLTNPAGFTAYGAGYYCAGDVVSLAVAMPEAPSGYRYVFEGWSYSAGVVEGFSDAEEPLTFYCMDAYDDVLYATFRMEKTDGSQVNAEEILAEKPVLELEAHEAYLNGYADNTIRPNRNITRGEVASIFYRLLTKQSRMDWYTDVCTYTDVTAENWYHDAVATLSGAGILTGYDDGTFGAEKTITRGEFAAVLVRFNQGIAQKDSGFTDVSADHWAADAIALCKELGWITGYADGTFGPEQPITRAEAAVMINRVLERDCEGWGDVVRSWKDLTPDNWYYSDLMEASNTHEAETE